MTTGGPTLAGFTTFVRDVMKLNTKQLPDSSPFIVYALRNAMAIVNPALYCDALPIVDAAGVSLGSPLSVYTEAVYNLAADNLINYAPDQPGFKTFATLRRKLNIAGFVSGVVQGSGDEGTSVSLVVQEAAKAFTLANLQQLKTPYGRTYLAFAQSYGPSTWGMS